MKKVFSLLFSLFSLGLCAGIELGSEITYKQLGGSNYRITLKLYRSCTAAALDSIKQIRIYSEDSSAERNIDLVRTEISRHTIKNDGSTYCDPLNNAGTNGNYSWEVHTYTSNVDLNTAPFHAGICRYFFGYQTASRKVYSSVGTDSSFNYAFLDRCFNNNNSVSFYFSPRSYAGLNQPVYMNFAGVDTLDIYDSMVYQMAPYYRVQGDTGIYPSGINYSRPLSVYSIGGITNPGANPPIGFYCDRRSGDMICTPVSAGNFVLVQEVLEYRRIDSEVKLVGIVRRDLSLEIISQPGNNPPRTSMASWAICTEPGGQIAIQAQDPVFTVAPPGVSFTDTTDIQIAPLSRGMSFTIDSSSRERTLRLTYQRDSTGITRPLLVLLGIRANDNHPGYFASSERALAITVIPKLYIDSLLIINKGCAKRKFEAVYDSSRYKGLVFTWSIQRLRTSTPILYFNNTESPEHRFTDSGDYRVSCSIRFPGFGCEGLFTDTFRIDTAGLTLEVYPRDTSFCFPVDSALRLNAHVGNINGTLFHSWQHGDSTAKPTVKIPWSDSTVDYKFNYQVQDAQGCTLSDSSKIRVFYRPKLNVVIDPDSAVCYKKITASNRVNYYKPVQQSWEFNSMTIKNDSFIYPTDAGYYRLNAWSNGCWNKVDTFIYVRPSPFTKIDADAKDVLCLGKTVNFYDNSKSAQLNFKRKWFVDSVLQPFTPQSIAVLFKDTGSHSVMLVSSVMYCSDTAILKYRVYENPRMTKRWIEDSVQCFYGNKFRLYAEAVATDQTVSPRWQFGNTYYSDSLLISIANSGSSIAYFTPTTDKGCTSSYPFHLTVHPKPFKPTILHYGTMLVAYPPNEMGYKHRWYLNGNLMSNANGVDTIWADWPGDYVLESGLDPECTAFSDPLHFYGVGQKEIKDVSFRISPNPGQGLFELQFSHYDSYHLLVYNAQGQLLKNESFSSKQYLLDLAVSPGVYCLLIKNSQGQSSMQKFVVE